MAYRMGCLQSEWGSWIIQLRSSEAPFISHNYWAKQCRLDPWGCVDGERGFSRPCCVPRAFSREGVTTSLLVPRRLMPGQGHTLPRQVLLLWASKAPSSERLRCSRFLTDTIACFLTGKAAADFTQETKEVSPVITKYNIKVSSASSRTGYVSQSSLFPSI